MNPTIVASPIAFANMKMIAAIVAQGMPTSSSPLTMEIIRKRYATN